MGPRSGNARIWWDPAVAAYRMLVPYNPQFNELFKSLMPHSDRAWDPNSKIWTWPEKYLDPVTKLITTTFGTPLVITRGQTEKASSTAPVKAASIEAVMANFFKLIPYEAAQTAYKRAAMMLHPDRGGDMEKMSELNALWQKLEAEFFKK